MGRDKEEVKERIVEAAMKIFASNGYFKASASAIAREAGVSKGLLFWYFRSKDELILEVARRSLPIDVLDRCLGEGFERDRLLRCIGEGYLEKYKDPVYRNLMLHTMSIRTVYPQVEESLREICTDYTRRVSMAVFGGESIEYRIRVRTFFGSLLCYTLRPPPDISEEEYLERLINIIVK
ncbi:MAG: TetR/AcrR family transcriptional regulator [Desulfurococcales archaeon]|nr:TetR/AcrR family transcriptional regulator [Desulfurococcales archaeon]